VFKTDKQIENPATCEPRSSATRFPNVRDTEPADVRRQICEVHGKNATSDSTVRRRVRLSENFVAQHGTSDGTCLAAVLFSSTTMSAHECKNEVKEAVNTWLHHSQAAYFYDDRIQKAVMTSDEITMDLTM